MVRYSEQWLAARLAQRKAEAPERSQPKPPKPAPPPPPSECRPAPVLLVLPWPPTGNTATRHPAAGVHYLTDEHHAFREEVARRAMAAGSPRVRSPFTALVYWYPPDERRRDSDNVQKTMFDALKLAGVIADDSMRDKINYSEHVRFEPAERAGTVHLMLWEE